MISAHQGVEIVVKSFLECPSFYFVMINGMIDHQACKAKVSGQFCPGIAIIGISEANSTKGSKPI
jgi:hypothetical protein